MTDKWMPEVGQECERRWLNSAWRKCLYIGKDRNGIDIVHDYGKEFCVTVQENNEFRPNQTEADKYREKQLFKIVDASKGMPCIGKQTMLTFSIAEKLYDAGCRVLAHDERIVKPLSVGQKNYLWKNHGVSWTVSDLVQSVQCELEAVD